MTAPTLFISDLHLTPKRPQSNQQFFEFLETEALDAAALYILGDLFDYWIGDDAASALGQSKVVEHLYQYSKRQSQIYFMRGNRDFLVGKDFTAMSGCQLLPDETIVTIDGEPVLLMHGDSLCTDDTAHQSFRHMVLDPDWQRQFLALDLAQRSQMATDARSQSELHKSLTSMEIMDVNPAAVVSVMQQHKVTRLIHGHTHRPAIHALELGDQKGERVVLGDWYKGSSVLQVKQGRYQLHGSRTPSGSAVSA